jgi:hypothetical protein
MVSLIFTLSTSEEVELTNKVNGSESEADKIVEQSYHGEERKDIPARWIETEDGYGFVY